MQIIKWYKELQLPKKREGNHKDCRLCVQEVDV